MQELGLIITLGTRELEFHTSDLDKILGEETTQKIGRPRSNLA